MAGTGVTLILAGQYLKEHPIFLFLFSIGMLVALTIIIYAWRDFLRR